MQFCLDDCADSKHLVGLLQQAGHSVYTPRSESMAGASERSIMNQTGHRSTAMVRRYIRDGSLFRDNSARMLAL